MSESTCYYYDEQHNRCNCYVNKNLDELLAENAKLKADVERMFQANVEKNNEVLKLLEDNAKLRELVEKYEMVLADYRSEVGKLREMASVLRRCLGNCLNGEDCDDGCPMLDADGWCNRDNRLQEMGIEVGE